MRYAILFMIFFGFITQEDRDNRDFYLKHFETHFTEEVGSLRIPETFHCVWLGHTPFPSMDNLAQWKAAHPHWRVCLWMDHLPSKVPEGIELRSVDEVTFELLGDLYHQANHYGEKSEILRLEILYSEGGVYIDHDTRPIQSFDPLNRQYDFYAGLEKDGSSILSTSIFPSTHLMAARSRHFLIHNAMRAWLRDSSEDESHDSSSLYSRVRSRSINALKVATRSMCLFGTKDIIFPHHYFSEKHTKKGLFATHAHLGSWHQFDRVAEEQVWKRVRKLEKHLSTTQTLLFVVLGCNLLLGFLFLRKIRVIALLPFLFFVTSCQDQISEFEKHMGKGTAHWKHVLTTEQSQLTPYEKLYEKNKHLIKAPVADTKIPHVIHFIWVGPKAFPPQSIENVRTWIARHPTWRVKFWTDRPRPLPCSQMEFCDIATFHFSHLEKQYLDSHNYGEKSDILRYEILLQEGGVYVDHDANCLQSFENLHSHFDFYCGLEAPHPPFVGRNITSGNGVLGSRPNHPVIQKVLAFIGENWDKTSQKIRGNDPASKSDLVLARTYIALTHALETSVDIASNIDIVLPSAYFFAKKGIPSLYSQHFYATAWADNHADFPFHRSVEKKLSRVQKRSTQLLSLASAIILLNLSLLFWYFYPIIRKSIRQRND